MALLMYKTPTDRRVQQQSETENKDVLNLVQGAGITIEAEFKGQF